jgi:hypothetical protein
MVFGGFIVHADAQKTILQFTQELLIGRKIALVHSLTRQLDFVGLSRPQVLAVPLRLSEPSQTKQT